MNRTSASKWIAARTAGCVLVAFVALGGANCAAPSSKTAVEASGGTTGSGAGTGSGGTGAPGAGGTVADASANDTGTPGSGGAAGGPGTSAGGAGGAATPPDASAAGGRPVDAGGVDRVPDASAPDVPPPPPPPPPSGPGLVNPRTVTVTGSPLMTVPSGSRLPARAATGVPVDTLLRIGFDGTPALGAAGTVSIHLATDGSIVDTIRINDPYAIFDGTAAISALTTNTTSTKVNLIGGLHSGSNQVRVVNYVPLLISGNTAIIVPHNNKLAYGTSYYVTIDNGLLTGAIGGTAFAGITAATDWTFSIKAAPPATLNVAADNSADFATVQGAIDSFPPGSTARTIDIAPGVYQEMLFLRSKNNVTLVGSNNGLGTVIQYDSCDGFNPSTGGGQTVSTPGAGGTIPGYGAAAGNLTAGGRPILLTSSSSGLVLDSITIKNLHAQGSRTIATLPPSTIAAGATSAATFVNYASAVTQAETMYFNTSFTADISNPAAVAYATGPGTLVAKHSNFVSYQDTLELKGVSWFYDCFVTGDTDFIWGGANTALFEQCEIKSRNNPNGSAVVQSRAFLSAGTTGLPASFNQSFPGFVFLNSALTKEAGTFTVYLARSAAPVAAQTVTGATLLYSGYDIVSYINCTMDTHIAPVGWNVTGGNPPGANVRASAVAGWREYRSRTPGGVLLDVSQRLGDPAPGGTAATATSSGSPGGSLQLSAAIAAAFFPDRATILHGATSGGLATTGLGTFNPAP